MLILPDSSSLGDTHLSPEENVAKLKEGIANTLETKKIKNQADLENVEMSLGEVLQPNDFIRRVEKINSDINIKKGGYPGAVQVRFMTWDADHDSPTFGTKVSKYVSGFFVDRPLQEFSIIVPGPNGLATRHIRGWRTVLLDLFHAGALTYPQIKAAFGEPLGQRNGLWMEQTQTGRA